MPKALKSILLSLTLIVCLLPSTAKTQQHPSKPNAAAEVTLKTFLQSYLGKSQPKENEDDQCLVAWVDLNDDGGLEAIVFVQGRSWCGSGGCHTLVLTPHGTTYRVVTETTITRLPIRVMREKSYGWHDLSVTVGGGGIAGNEARLRFNGKKYPSNPTVPPAQPIKGVAHGHILLSPTDTNTHYIYR